MALSVLVALMMLAVPLASSSNLFVDGGQTNSNGDAPLSAESTPSPSYRVDFILNEGSDGRISLDEASVAVDKLDKASDKIAWYSGEDGNIFAVVTGDVTIQYLLWALNKTYTDSGTDKNILSKTGYELDVWKDVLGSTYAPSSSDNAPTDGDKITKNMTLTAKWLFDDSKYAEIPVDVIVDGELFKEYVKVYPKFKESDETNIDEKNVYLYTTGTFIATGVKGVSEYGVIVNFKNVDGKIIAKEDSVYSFKTTYGDDKELSKAIAKDDPVKIPVASKLTMTYTFDEKNFSKIVVSSVAFKDGKDVTLYADKNRGYTYGQVLEALRFSSSDNNIKAAIVLKNLETNPGSSAFYFKDGKAITENGYEISGWNEGAQLLQSENSASSPLTLDAKLNGYYALFMSKGQFEYVYIPSGDLSADLVKTLDITGVNHWAWLQYNDGNDNANDDYVGKFTASSFKTFGSFTDSLIDEVENMIPEKYDGETPIAVFVACFESIDNTAYAVFDGAGANFGNEYVTKLIIPGKIATKIVKPTIAPVYDQDESRTLFMGWTKQAQTEPKTASILSTGASADPKDDVYEKDKLTIYEANPQSYDYKITFYDGSEIVGVFYYYTYVPTIDITTGLVAFEYGNKAYEAIFDTETNLLKLGEEAQKAYNNILIHEKDGYLIKQWDDVDKNKVITIEKGTVTKTDVKDMKDDLNLYAQFDAKSYTIKYVNTFEGTQNQIAYVDQNTTLYGTGTFIHEGYDLKAWSTVPGNSGDKYDLGATFVLNGADYEKLAESAGDDGVVIELYSVWEYNGGSDVPGSNTGGDNDNTALYLIAGMLAVIAILAIVGILLMRRK